MLTGRRKGEFQDVRIWLKKHRLEEIHEYSRTPLIIDLPTTARITKLPRTTTSLNKLRRIDLSQDSLEARELISPYEIAPPGSVSNKDFYIRTLGEIEEISRLYDGLEKGKDKDKRKELRQLRDRLIIDRIVVPYALKNLPEYIRASVGLNNRLVTVFVITGEGEDEFLNEQPLIIEAPIEGRYSAERNRKLTESLGFLGLF